MIKRVNRSQAEDLRESVETEMLSVVDQAMRSYLRELKAEALSAVRSYLPNVMVAAAGEEMPTLGDAANIWADRVDTQIMYAVEAAYERSFHRWSDQGLTIDSPQMSASRDYIASVRDRLVVGTHMSTTVYGDSFDKIRSSLAQSAAEGWSRDQLAQRIAAELSWEKEGPYWRQILSDTDKSIDSILDKIGPSGDPAREHARLHDPKVNSLRVDRNTAIKHLDAERSVWRTRATLIARTESTGAANFGALQAMTMEGVDTKVWMATGDTRTRPTHSSAEGQEVGIARPFNVGGSLMQFPGDPNGPITEVANCRCTMIQGDL